MRWLKYFEDKMNNREGSLITKDDVIDCIKNGGVIYTSSVRDYDENDSTVGIKPINIDNDGLITVDIGGLEYYVDINNVESIEN